MEISEVNSTPISGSIFHYRVVNAWNGFARSCSGGREPGGVEGQADAVLDTLWSLGAC